MHLSVTAGALLPLRQVCDLHIKRLGAGLQTKLAAVSVPVDGLELLVHVVDTRSDIRVHRGHAENSLRQSQLLEPLLHRWDRCFVRRGSSACALALVASADRATCKCSPTRSVQSGICDVVAAIARVGTLIVYARQVLGRGADGSRVVVGTVLVLIEMTWQALVFFERIELAGCHDLVLGHPLVVGVVLHRIRCGGPAPLSPGHIVDLSSTSCLRVSRVELPVLIDQYRSAQVVDPLGLLLWKVIQIDWRRLAEE